MSGAYGPIGSITKPQKVIKSAKGIVTIILFDTQKLWQEMIFSG
jgi:hypothetical protein